MNDPVNQPWWLVGVAVLSFAIGFTLEFTGKDGNSFPGAIVVLVGFVALGAFAIVSLRRRKANR